MHAHAHTNRRRLRGHEHTVRLRNTHRSARSRLGDVSHESTLARFAPMTLKRAEHPHHTHRCVQPRPASQPRCGARFQGYRSDLVPRASPDVPREQHITEVMRCRKTTTHLAVSGPSFYENWDHARRLLGNVDSDVTAALACICLASLRNTLGVATMLAR